MRDHFGSIMVQPLVSVIIPAYNAEKWIEETVLSAISQTYSPLEVIVIDDMSTDHTFKKLEPFASKVILLRNTSNLGVSGSRNKAIAQAHGEFIALLDHDDLWNQDKLSKQMRLFENTTGLALVFSDCRYRTPEGKTWRSFEASPPYRGRVFEKLLVENFIPCLTAVMPRHVLQTIGGFREDMKALEDHELFLRIADRYPVDYVDEPLATYRIHDANFTRRRDIYHSERLLLQKLYSSRFPLQGEMALQHLGLGAALLRSGQLRAGALTLAKGLGLAASHVPQSVRAASQTWHRRRRIST